MTSLPYCTLITTKMHIITLYELCKFGWKPRIWLFMIRIMHVAEVMYIINMQSYMLLLLYIYRKSIIMKTVLYRRL